MKKINYIGIWGAIVIYLIVSLSFVGEKRKNTICSHINVHIIDSTADDLITSKEIKEFVYDLDMDVLGHPIKKINTQYLEQTLTDNAVIRNAEVFFTSNGNLNIEIDQRNPIIRINNQKGQSYYIDQEGFIVPSKATYTSHVLVANGHIKENFEPAKAKRINCNSPGNGVSKEDNICELIEIAKFIENNNFWKAQIEQIYIDSNGEYELIPRVGAHIIKFGTPEKFQEKFRNLKAFYKKGLNNVGWNQYLYINLKYDNQIICTKR
ncbi:MAG: cell division protein FtsQ/DivIB [Bacteroidales bacterium]